jgi:hypothetical protein
MKMYITDTPRCKRKKERKMVGHTTRSHGHGRLVTVKTSRADFRSWGMFGQVAYPDQLGHWKSPQPDVIVLGLGGALALDPIHVCVVLF